MSEDAGAPFSWESAPDEEIELEALRRALSLARGFKLLFVRYFGEAQREELERDARAAVADRPVLALRIGPAVTNLLPVLRERVEVMAAPPALVLVSGFDEALPDPRDAQRSLLVANLNATRDFFPQLLSCPLIFFLPQYVLPALARGAPDFFSGRSHAFLFPEHGSRLASQELRVPGPQPPGAPYDPAWYVLRGPETTAVRILRQGVPLLIQGPAHYGKSQFIEHVVREWAVDDAYRRITVDCATLSLVDPAALLRAFAVALAGDNEALRARAMQRWKVARQTAAAELFDFLEQDILRPAPGPVLLVLENAHAVLAHPVSLHLLGLLRPLLEQELQLRLLIAAETPGMLFSHQNYSSPLADMIVVMGLRDLDREHVLTLAERYGNFSPSEMDALIAQAAGHPYLLRFYLYEAAQQGVSLNAVLGDPALTESLVGRMATWLPAIPAEHRAALTRLAAGGGAPLDRDLQEWLQQQRLLSKDGHRLRCRLYEQLCLRLAGR